MILKAGTYRFNETLTEAEFNQDIDFTIDGIADGISFSVYCSNLRGGVKSFLDGTISWALSIFEDKFIEDGEENVLGIEVDVYMGTAGWLTTPAEAFVHTITEDTEVNDTFGTWYKANTDYDTVNGGGESVLGLRRFVDNPDIASLSDIVPAETLESDLTDFYMEYTCNGVTYNLLIGQINEGAAGGYGLLYFNDEDVEICNPYLTTDGWNAEYGDEVRNINITKAPQSTELYAWLLANTEAVEETPTVTRKFTRLYLGEIVYSSNGKRFRKLQTEEYVEPSEPASEGLAFTSNGDGTCSVSGIGTCADMEIVIPSISPNGDIVVSIGNYAFWHCESLTSIEIPNSVTSIGGSAFSDCTSLTSITIPNSVTSIDVYAFRRCELLTSIEIPNSVTSIGGRAFYDCTSLTSITIPNSVTSIGIYAFYRCESLTSIEIPNSVTSIGNGLFQSCTSLTSITIPDSVTIIDDWAFDNCSSLTSIEIPNSVTSIGGRAFEGCTSLTSITIPNSVTSIGSSAFYGCSSLTSIEIPDSVTIIDVNAFRFCSALISVEIPHGVTNINNNAFDGCDSLTNVTIPNSVTNIANYAFRNCGLLANITFDGTVEQWNAIIKGEWNLNIPATYVQCTDGQVTL